MSKYLHSNDPPGLRRCCGCKKYVPLEQFHKDNRAKGGLRTLCKSCKAAEISASLARIGDYGQHVRQALIRGLRPLQSRAEYNQITQLPCVFGNGRRPSIHINPDRIDSNKGYEWNSQPCCPYHNQLKSDFDDDLVREMIRRHPNLAACRNREPRKAPRQMNIIPMIVECKKPDERVLPLFEKKA